MTSGRDGLGTDGNALVDYPPPRWEFKPATRSAFTPAVKFILIPLAAVIGFLAGRYLG